MLKIQIGISSSLRSVAHKNNLTNFYKWFYFRVWSPLLIAANQSSLYILVFCIEGGRNFFIIFDFEKLKKIYPLFCLITLKLLILRKQNSLAVILHGFLWNWKKKKVKIIKKIPAGILDSFGLRSNWYYP